MLFLLIKNIILSYQWNLLIIMADDEIELQAKLALHQTFKSRFFDGEIWGVFFMVAWRKFPVLIKLSVLYRRKAPLAPRHSSI